MNRSLVALVVSTLVACAGGGDDGGNIDAPDTPTATLVVTTSGGGGGTVTSAPAGIDCGSDCSEAFDVGTSVTLTATADNSSTFLGWSGGGCSGTGACTVTLSADTAVTAMFQASGSLSVTVEGNGTGTVTSNPAGISCAGDCTELYPAGTMVTLTATPDAASSFTGWSGSGCTGTATCVVTVTAAHTVTATFARNRYTLTTVLAGMGQGTVASTPVGISCGADCTEDYDHGTMVTLNASAAAGSSFMGWTGGGCSGTGSCNVTLTAATTVTATFSLNIESVTVMKNGNGSGTVTSAPAGIDCGVDCVETYPVGTMVTLTATPATGSVFAGWSGACTGTGACTVTVDMAIGVTATFNLQQVTLTVVRAGNGTGTVTSTPVGISCGADCTETVNYGTVLTLSASPAVGSTFGGWSGGGCSGVGPCVVPMTAATTVTATFTLNQYTLSVVRAGTGSGTVTSSPAGINCGADCAEVYNHGTVVTLIATPSAGQAFTGWTGGGCTGTGSCAVTMTASNTVTATFTVCPTGSTTFNYTGAAQSFTVPACVTSITIDAYGAQGGASTGQTGGMNFTGGLGARARGTFAVSGGQVLDVRVGGMGLTSNCGAGGGGGSYVVRSGAALVIAGGGGGGFHCTVLGGLNGVGGNTTTTGGTGVCTTNPMYPRNPTAGGTAGAGATCYFGGGGGGFLSSGVSSQLAGAGGGGYPAGSAGGAPGGGYGGGGGYHNTCCGGSGGGGGYSGGGGSANDGCAGGGGGSINNGTAQIMTAATRSGNGTVIISY